MSMRNALFSFLVVAQPASCFVLGTTCKLAAIRCPRCRKSSMGVFDFLSGNDEQNARDQKLPKGFAAVSHILLKSESDAEALKERIQSGAVSYTHLTLPTIYSV